MNTILSDYSDFRYKEATDLDQYIDEINKASNNKKDDATVDSYRLMVKIIDLQSVEIRDEANENVKSLAAIQTDLSRAYILKAERFEEVISKIPNTRRSTNKILKSDASLLRDQAGTLSNNANSTTSPQSFAKSMAKFYRDRSKNFADLGKSGRGSFEEAILKKHSK